jgi:hypothetical protein
MCRSPDEEMRRIVMSDTRRTFSPAFIYSLQALRVVDFPAR